MKIKIFMVKYQHICTCIMCTSKQRRLIKVNALRPSAVAHTCNQSEHFGRLRWEDCLSS
uniref:Macaca fascicularis brain cDNA clone: QtrA-17606, similar to human riboflavin kinase (FLJ11149), mRNA, RefSeq: NM_018339.3 n=1 Tax=Macaca fascicularis TaxID=9541 RepID=I7GPJ7_MACFA|nr:unnamed protein product [Macaca fascicularis]